MRQITVREALRDAMAEEMRLDPNVILLGEEVGEYQGAYKVTQGLVQEFGKNRVIDTPISEHGFAGLGVGAALSGLKPIVEFMTFNFAMQAIDHIANSAAKTYYMSGGKVRCPILFRGPNGSAASVAAQHSQNYAAWYSHIPGLKVIAPYTAKDSKGLLKSAIRDPNPVIFLEHEMLYPYEFDLPEDNELIEIGKADVTYAGKDVTIVSFSLQMHLVYQVRDILKKQNIEVEVIDLRTITPLDKETIIKSVKKTNRLVVVEECWFFAGIGATIASIVMEEAFDYLDAPVKVVSAKAVPLPYAKNLEKLALPNLNNIIDAVRQVCYSK